MSERGEHESVAMPRYCLLWWRIRRIFQFDRWYHWFGPDVMESKAKVKILIHSHWYDTLRDSWSGRASRIMRTEGGKIVIWQFSSLSRIARLSPSKDWPCQAHMHVYVNRLMNRLLSGQGSTGTYVYSSKDWPCWSPGWHSWWSIPREPVELNFLSIDGAIAFYQCLKSMQEMDMCSNSNSWTVANSQKKKQMLGDNNLCTPQLHVELVGINWEAALIHSDS